MAKLVWLVPLLLTTVLVINSQKFSLEEATIDDIQSAFAQNTLTSLQLTDFYIQQITTLNPLLRSMIELNPDARQLAQTADDVRIMRNHNNQNSRTLGKLHGVPVLLKDTIATKDKMNTTAGSYALVGAEVERDATVVERLREAGAVILGKASLSEWYKFRSLSKLPNGWCARAGQGANPYSSGGDPCGSSSGSAISVAANMVAVSLGTETHSSIICPSDHNSVVGFKPTVGLTSRAGVIPVMPSLDTIGPITRTVSDSIYLLEVIAGYDSRDEATREAAKYIPVGGYMQFLNLHGLEGKRIGIVRNPFLKTVNESIALAFEEHMKTLKKRGAILVDDLEIPNIETIMNPGRSGELTLMKAEFKQSLNKYLKELIDSPVRSLADIIAFNENHRELERLEEIGQDTFLEADKTNGIGVKEMKAIELMERLSGEGFEKMIVENELDAMVTPGSGAVPVLAIGGYPGITVPAGYYGNGMPFGILFSGVKGSEPKLIEIAYAFEQVTKIRRPPFLRSVEFNTDFQFGSV